jgi:hypothetical protein
MLHNLQGIVHYSYVGEFAKGQGAIHTHGTGYSNTAVDQEIDDFLVKLAIDSYRALKEIDEFIYEHIEPEDHLPSKDDEEPTNPLEIVGKEGMDARRQFLSTSPERLQTLKNFDAKLDAIKREAAKGIWYEMENKFGYSATHIGKASSDWVNLGGQPGSGHRLTSSDSMISKADVGEKKVLQKFKFEHKDELYDHRRDMTNHAFTHQCSDYCWKPVVINVPYDRSKHGPLKNNDRVVSVLEKKAPDTSWTYLALRKGYEEYGQKVDGLVPPLNFYMWCARHGTRGSSSVVPDFVGYYKRPN